MPHLRMGPHGQPRLQTSASFPLKLLQDIGIQNDISSNPCRLKEAVLYPPSDGYLRDFEIFRCFPDSKRRLPNVVEHLVVAVKLLFEASPGDFGKELFPFSKRHRQDLFIDFFRRYHGYSASFYVTFKVAIEILMRIYHVYNYAIILQLIGNQIRLSFECKFMNAKP